MERHKKQINRMTKKMNNIILSYSDGHLTDYGFSELIEQYKKEIIEIYNKRNHKYYYDKESNKFVYGIPEKS